jgi:farnesyl-diphosphate farnesyltransferase
LEEPSLATELHLSDQMGLFLQKTNIIRDYLEDYVDGRAFWPQSVWKKYSLSGDLGYFAKPTTVDATNAGLQCLNELVTDALELVPDCLAYLSKLRCSEVFRFCAIPQVMAIATLDKCYHNANVFTGVVKIRKGMSCLLINNTTDFLGVHGIFYKFAGSIMKKAESARKGGFNDPSFDRTIKACQTIIELTEVESKKASSQGSLVNGAILAAGIAAGCLTYSSPGSSNTSALTTATLASFGMYSFFQIGVKKFVCHSTSLLPASKLCKD